jgi:hypothetical protein
MSDKPRAIVREVNGQLVLDDPDALAVARAVAKHNCRLTLEAHADRVAHFIQRVSERSLDPLSVVIVLLNVDDPQGGAVADVLMPGHDWQAYRDRGERPYARGLATREGMQQVLDSIDTEAATKLRAGESVPIVVMDYGTVEVFTV